MIRVEAFVSREFIPPRVRLSRQTQHKDERKFGGSAGKAEEAPPTRKKHDLLVERIERSVEEESVLRWESLSARTSKRNLAENVGTQRAPTLRMHKRKKFRRISPRGKGARCASYADPTRGNARRQVVCTRRDARIVPRALIVASRETRRRMPPIDDNRYPCVSDKDTIEDHEEGEGVLSYETSRVIARPDRPRNVICLPVRRRARGVYLRK